MEWMEKRTVHLWRGRDAVGVMVRSETREEFRESPAVQQVKAQETLSAKPIATNPVWLRTLVNAPLGCPAPMRTASDCPDLCHFSFSHIPDLLGAKSQQEVKSRTLTTAAAFPSPLELCET